MWIWIPFEICISQNISSMMLISTLIDNASGIIYSYKDIFRF